MKQLRRRRRSKESQEFPVIALTSLIDVAFVLLVMLIVASRNMHHGLGVSLPYGKLQEARNVQSKHTLTVAKDGSLLLNTKKIKIDSLMQELQKDMASSKDKILFVYGDRNCEYGTVMKVVSNIREENQKKNNTTGVERVVLVTNPIA